MSPAPSVNKWLVLATTALGAFMGAVMFTAINVALPSLAVMFETDFGTVQWVVLAYLLATGALLPIIGRLADMLGKKRLFGLGYIIFTIGSLLCAVSPTIGLLIVFRGLQGLGAAFLTALSLAIITDTFPAEERGLAIGINGSVLSVGIVAGPTLGGFLIDFVSWQFIFISAVPLGVIGTILSQRYIANYASGRREAFDLLGALLLFGVLLTLFLGLTLGQGIGFAAPSILGLFGISLICLILFLWRELRVSSPVIDLRMFRNMQLSLGLITGFATFISISATIFLMPFYLANILGYSAQSVGLLMSISPVVLVITAPLSGRLADRFGERPITVIGLVILLGGYIAMTSLSTDTTALGYILRFLPVGIGMGIFQTPNNSAIMGSVVQARSGVAGGLLALTRTLGQSAGIAVLGTLWASRVLHRADLLTGDATRAPAFLQVEGLQEMFLFIQVMIALALFLAIWDFVMRRRYRRVTATSSAD
jgi:EmrB/QacA subfamily drug resistance transporter